MLELDVQSAVKEQKNNDKLMVVSIFSEKCGKQERDSDALNLAVDYYKSCSDEEQYAIRHYVASNGEVDLSRFSKRVGMLCPAGMANQMEKMRLETWIKKELAKRNTEEREMQDREDNYGIVSLINQKGDINS